jgi:aerobic carbon-monoxide dehydrogenase medium subunit
MLAPFEIHEPKTVAEASALLRHHGDEAAVYAGGTELLVLMKERISHFPHLVNIKTIPGLNEIRLDGDELVIGALATHRHIANSELVQAAFPVLAKLEYQIANVRVRNAGTLGGNLCFAEPHSDPATLLIALGAHFVLASGKAIRTVAAELFFTRLLETDRRPDEILTAIRIPRLPDGTRITYERFKTHERPAATVAVALLPDGETRIVVGSVAARPARMRSAEAALTEMELTSAAIGRAAGFAAAEIDPTEDVFESVAYKRHLVRALVRRALETAAREQA